MLEKLVNIAVWLYLKNSIRKAKSRLVQAKLAKAKAAEARWTALKMDMVADEWDERANKLADEAVNLIVDRLSKH